MTDHTINQKLSIASISWSPISCNSFYGLLSPSPHPILWEPRNPARELARRLGRYYLHTFLAPENPSTKRELFTCFPFYGIAFHITVIDTAALTVELREYAKESLKTVKSAAVWQLRDILSGTVRSCSF